MTSRWWLSVAVCRRNVAAVRFARRGNHKLAPPPINAKSAVSAHRLTVYTPTPLSRSPVLPLPSPPPARLYTMSVSLFPLAEVLDVYGPFLYEFLQLCTCFFFLSFSFIEVIVFAFSRFL